MTKLSNIGAQNPGIMAFIMGEVLSGSIKEINCLIIELAGYNMKNYVFNSEDIY